MFLMLLRFILFITCHIKSTLLLVVSFQNFVKYLDSLHIFKNRLITKKWVYLDADCNSRFWRRQQIRRILDHLVCQFDGQIAGGGEESVSVNALGSHQLDLEIVLDLRSEFPENVNPR